MEEQNKQTELSNPTPAPTPPPQSPAPVTSTPSQNPVESKLKTIQPSKEFLDEIKTSPVSTAPNVGKAPVGATPPVIPPVQQANVAQTSANVPTNNIYPDPVDLRLSAPVSKPIESNGTLGALTMENGKSAGATIFIYQMIVLFVFYVISYFLILGIQHGGGSKSVNQTISFVLLGVYLIVLALVIIIPYKIVQSENVPAPFWVALTGFSTLGFMGLIFGYFLLYRVVYITFLLTASLYEKAGHGGDILINFGYLIIILCIGYMISKYVYGLIFKLFGKAHSLKLIKIVGVSLLVLIIAYLFYHGLTLQNTKNNVSKVEHSKTQITYQNNNNNVSTGPVTDPAPASYSMQTFHAHDFNVSFKFDPNYNATITYNPVDIAPLKEVSQVEVQGMALGDVGRMTVNVGRFANPSKFGLSATNCTSTKTSGAGLKDQQVGTFSINNKQYAICSNDGNALGNESAFFEVDNNWYAITLGPTTPNSATANAIFNSLKIN